MGACRSRQPTCWHSARVQLGAERAQHNQPTRGRREARRRWPCSQQAQPGEHAGGVQAMGGSAAARPPCETRPVCARQQPAARRFAACSASRLCSSRRCRSCPTAQTLPRPRWSTCKERDATVGVGVCHRQCPNAAAKQWQREQRAATSPSKRREPPQSIPALPRNPPC